MQLVSPTSNVEHFITDSNTSETLKSHFAYHTPPYETTSNKPKSLHSSKNSSLALITNITRMMSFLTLKLSNSDSKIDNSFKSINPFVTEILKRSKSNKLVALLACHYFKKVYSNFEIDDLETTSIPEFAKCSKRIFLSCLILSHKFNNDNTFSMKTWSSMCGLKLKDIATMERWCLNKLNYELFIKAETLIDSEKTLFKNQEVYASPRCLKRKINDEFEAHKMIKVNN